MRKEHIQQRKRKKDTPKNVNVSKLSSHGEGFAMARHVAESYLHAAMKKEPQNGYGPSMTSTASSSQIGSENQFVAVKSEANTSLPAKSGSNGLSNMTFAHQHHQLWPSHHHHATAAAALLQQQNGNNTPFAPFSFYNLPQTHVPATSAHIESPPVHFHHQVSASSASQNVNNFESGVVSS